MNRQKKYIIMSRQTVWLVFFATLLGHLPEVIIVYISVIIHECAHLYICKRLKIRTKYMAVFPYGMELKLREIPIPANQIKISAAGPASNFVLFSAGYFLIKQGISSHLLSFAASANFILFSFNLLPCVPLDGSEILRSFISSRAGILTSYAAIRKISAVFEISFLLLGTIWAHHTNGNVSLLIIAVIVLQSLSAQKNERIHIVKAIIAGEIHSNPLRTRILHCDEKETAISIIRRISFDYTLIISCNNRQIPQEKLLELTAKKPSLTVGECIEMDEEM